MHRSWAVRGRGKEREKTSSKLGSGEAHMRACVLDFFQFKTWEKLHETIYGHVKTAFNLILYGFFVRLTDDSQLWNRVSHFHVCHYFSSLCIIQSSECFFPDCSSRFFSRFFRKKIPSVQRPRILFRHFIGFFDSSVSFPFLEWEFFNCAVSWYFLRLDLIHKWCYWGASMCWSE